jgi:Ricin-type beta-trefoil lectin domain.
MTKNLSSCTVKSVSNEQKFETRFVCFIKIHNSIILFQNQELRHVDSKLCLDLSSKHNYLVLNACNGYTSQRWELESVSWK